MKETMIFILNNDGDMQECTIEDAVKAVNETFVGIYKYTTHPMIPFFGLMFMDGYYLRSSVVDEKAESIVEEIKMYEGEKIPQDVLFHILGDKYEMSTL